MEGNVQDKKKTQRQTWQSQSSGDLGVGLIVKHHYNFLRECRDFESTDRISYITFISNSIIKLHLTWLFWDPQNNINQSN